MGKSAPDGADNRNFPSEIQELLKRAEQDQKDQKKEENEEKD